MEMKPNELDVKPTELHFIRVRHKDSKDPFCDPMADIKQVGIQAFKELVPLYIKVFNDTDKADYLKAILKVFITRLEEDPQPLNIQIKRFRTALKQLPKRHVDFIISAFAEYVFDIFALFYRRDAQVDNKDKNAFKTASGLLMLDKYLKPETYKKVIEEMREVYKFIETTNNSVISVDAECIENGDVLEDIKDTAAMSLGATGNNTWDDVAKACDQYVINNAEADNKAVAVALAYPDYPTPYFEVTVNK